MKEDLKFKSKKGKLIGINLEKPNRRTILISGKTAIDSFIFINCDCNDERIEFKPNRPVKKSDIQPLLKKLVEDPLHLYKFYLPILVNEDTMHILDGQHQVKSIIELGKISKSSLDKVLLYVDLWSGDTVTSFNEDGSINMNETICKEGEFIKKINVERINMKDSDIINLGKNSPNPEISQKYINREEIENYIGSKLKNNNRYDEYKGCDVRVSRLVDIITHGKNEAVDRRIGEYEFSNDDLVMSKKLVDFLEVIQETTLKVSESGLNIFGKVKETNSFVKGARIFFMKKEVYNFSNSKIIEFSKKLEIFQTFLVEDKLKNIIKSNFYNMEVDRAYSEEDFIKIFKLDREDEETIYIDKYDVYSLLVFIDRMKF